MPTIEIYKRNQGKYTRLGTYCSAMLLGVIGAVLLGDKLSVLASIELGGYVKYGVPLVIILGMATFMFWLMNRPTTADFLIATEGEMKKVSWSSRKEIIGSTKVVIVTTVIISMMLLGVDTLFVFVFSKLHIMG